MCAVLNNAGIGQVVLTEKVTVRLVYTSHHKRRVFRPEHIGSLITFHIGFGQRDASATIVTIGNALTRNICSLARMKTTITTGIEKAEPELG